MTTRSQPTGTPAQARPQGRQQATALSLAALTTLCILGSIHMLASQPAQVATMAASPAASPVVVIFGQRLTRG